MNKKKLKIKLLEIFFVFLYSFILFLATYMMKTDNISNSIYVARYLIYNGAIQYLVIPYLIILSIQLIIKSIVKENWKTNIISTVIVLLITIISYYKYKILELPFLPSDIFMAGNINQIAEFGLTFPPINIILIVIVLCLILLLEYLINKKYNLLRTENSLGINIFRVSIFILGIIILYNLCISPSRYIRYNIKNDLGDNYSWMGGNAVFFMHLGDFYSITPEGYTKDGIENIKEESIEEQNNTTKDCEKPNVIMIMNESFSDPNNINNVKYSVNPIENIEELAKNDKNCIVGNTVVPVYGGGTSLTEFEALTGMSSYFVEKQIFPYTSYIRNDINSIVRVYNNNAYTTIGIHTNTQTFYNRKNVYKYLGFKQTLFEEDIENPEIKGKYISDNELVNQIINKFEENTDNKYIFGVSMQNHMPYTGNRYNEYDIEVNSDNLQENELKELKNYVQGIYDGDQMYIKLVNYLKTIEEPTILVMFGDHLPSLNSIYKQSNYAGLEYYTTPYVIWSNYDIEYQELNLSKYISPSNLSIKMMKLSNIEIPWYFKKFEELYQNYPVINNQCVITDKGKILNVDEISDYDLVNDCRILQYDLLIKKKYITIK